MRANQGAKNASHCKKSPSWRGGRSREVRGQNRGRARGRSRRRNSCASSCRCPATVPAREIANPAGYRARERGVIGRTWKPSSTNAPSETMVARGQSSPRDSARRADVWRAPTGACEVLTAFSVSARAGTSQQHAAALFSRRDFVVQVGKRGRGPFTATAAERRRTSDRSTRGAADDLKVSSSVRDRRTPPAPRASRPASGSPRPVGSPLFLREARG